VESLNVRKLSWSEQAPRRTATRHAPRLVKARSIATARGLAIEHRNDFRLLFLDVSCANVIFFHDDNEIAAVFRCDFEILPYAIRGNSRFRKS